MILKIIYDLNDHLKIFCKSGDWPIVHCVTHTGQVSRTCQKRVWKLLEDFFLSVGWS